MTFDFLHIAQPEVKVLCPYLYLSKSTQALPLKYTYSATAKILIQRNNVYYIIDDHHFNVAARNAGADSYFV